MLAKHCSEPVLPFDRFDDEVAELPLLLPAWQVNALEQAAQAQGVTVGQLLRQVVSQTLEQRRLQQPSIYYG